MANVTVKGLKEFQHALITAGPDAGRFAAKALREEADEAFIISQSVVPVRTGALLTSGDVTGPVTRGNRVQVEISYGGAAAPYAVFVHEVPPNSGGRWGTGYSHDAPTRWKFLENPVRLYSQGMGPRLTARVLDMVAKRFDIG